MRPSWAQWRVFARLNYRPVTSDALLAKECPYQDSKEAFNDGSMEMDDTCSKDLASRLVLTTGALLFFVFSTTVLLVAYILKKPSDRECGIQTSVWSPGNEAVEYKTINFDNAFTHQTIYRGPPSPELESAWEDLWMYEGVRIPEEKLTLLNRTSDLGDGKMLKAVDDEEGGYHALIEVFHQLHCLNTIRQYTWRDWYLRHQDIVNTPTLLLDGEVGARLHVDHCIETLRITLQCQGDMTPYLMMRDSTAPGGQRADFSPLHKCRNFEMLRSWAEKHQLMPSPKMDWVLTT